MKPINVKVKCSRTGKTLQEGKDYRITREPPIGKWFRKGPFYLQIIEGGRMDTRMSIHLDYGLKGESATNPPDCSTYGAAPPLTGPKGAEHYRQRIKGTMKDRFER